MTTVLERPIDGAGTHCLIIGVGAYEHLAGGADPVPELDPYGLTQLTSPPVSAVGFTRWLLDTPYTNSQAPLASIELLTSPATTLSVDGKAQTTERASLSAVRAAFRRWYDRADAHRDNVAIFYFCGHGVARETVALLLDDFGLNPLNPFENALDFVKNQLGMAGCQARTQWYFVDACRAVPHAVVNDLAIEAAVLAKPTARADFARSYPTLYATPHDQRAHGMVGQPSQFTAALLQALDGAGSEKIGDRWVITPGKLHQGVVAALAYEQAVAQADGRTAPEQLPTLDGSTLGTPTLHELPDAPIVRVQLGCRPEAADPHAGFALRRGRERRVRYKRDPAPGQWRTEVVAGAYDVGVKFDDRRFRVRRGWDRELLAMPPGSDRVVEVDTR